MALVLLRFPFAGACLKIIVVFVRGGLQDLNVVLPVKSICGILFTVLIIYVVLWITLGFWLERERSNWLNVKDI